MTRIALRLPDGWSEPVNNISPTHCDSCGRRLWQAPHGGLYCDATHYGLDSYVRVRPSMNKNKN